MKRLAISIVALALVGGTLALWSPAWLFGREVDSPEPASEGKPPESDDRADEHGGGEIRLTPAQIELAEIKSAAAASGSLAVTLSVAGEVTVDQDRAVDVVPLVPGTVRAARAVLGDQVQAGAVLAIIESRELADAMSTFIAARERTRLAQSKFERDDRLWRSRVVAEQEYLESRSALAEARIVERTAEQKLKALGLTDLDLRSLATRGAQSHTRFEVLAPIAGTVIAKQAATGESVDGAKPIYRIADLSKVWIIASVYERDFGRVAVGQRATVSARAYPERIFEGRITWISDVVEERTRTLKTRIEVDNPDRLLKPGMFVNAAIAVDVRQAAVTVPSGAVQRQKGETIVFVDEGDGRFERREVDLGASAGDVVEVVRGLKAGERVVTSGSFILKSELEKGGMEAGHGH